LQDRPAARAAQEQAAEQVARLFGAVLGFLPPVGQAEVARLSPTPILLEAIRLGRASCRRSRAEQQRPAQAPRAYGTTDLSGPTAARVEVPLELQARPGKAATADRVREAQAEAEGSPVVLLAAVATD